MSLSEVLKKRRSELGYTLLEIADKMGVSEATVQRWESGNIKSLRQGRIAQLAEVLSVSPAYLMGWEEKNETPDIEALKVALFSGNSEVTDEMWEEVVNFARFVEAREAQKNKKD